MTRAEFSKLYLQSNPGVDYTPLGPKLERRRVANLCGMTGQLEASGLAHALASTPTRLTEAEMAALDDTPGRDRADSTEQLQQRCARTAPPAAPYKAFRIQQIDGPAWQSPARSRHVDDTLY